MGLPELIPQSKLFGNPVKSQPRISPDGKRFAFLADSDKGVLNIFVQTVGEEDAKQVTNDTHRGIRFFEWANTNRHILFKQDADGDENWHVYSVDLDNTVTRDLTPFQGIRADSLFQSAKVPTKILVGLNIRDRSVFDMYSVDVLTGALIEDSLNPGDVAQWICDANLEIRGSVATNPEDGSKILRTREQTTHLWKEVAVWPHDEECSFHEFSADGKGIYVSTSLGHGQREAADTTRLVLLATLDGREVRELHHDARCDVDDVIFSDKNHTVEAVVVDYDTPQIVVLEDSVRADFEELKKLGDGRLDVVSRSHDEDKWMVSLMPDDASPKFFLYTRSTKTAQLLFLARPELEQYTLVKMSSHVIDTSDGEKLVAFRTLPTGVDPVKLPMVLLVHGGPWARDRWGWNPQAQWLSNRGYACVMCNFRASTGYGKRWLHLGDAQWGATMQQDLTDVVAWAVKEGFADPARVAIMGGSYGGYATLAGLAFTPELYCCGVDIVGPAHLKTLLQSTPSYWKPLKKMLSLRVGDVEADEELNQRCSPFFHADKMVKPLIIAQGANDPRVKKAESDQMVSAMHKIGTKVEYVLYSDEGHGFARPANRLDFYHRAELFLAAHAGGRSGSAEADMLAGSTAQILDPATLQI